MSWESVDGDDGLSATQRIAVPGGWLYRVVWKSGYQEGCGVAFVPAPIIALPPREDST